MKKFIYLFYIPRTKNAIVINHVPNEALKLLQSHDPDGHWEYAFNEIIGEVPSNLTNRVLAVEKGKPGAESTPAMTKAINKLKEKNENS